MLSLAGAYEFSNSPDMPPPPRKRLAFLAKAFDLMRYDALYVSQYERGLLTKAGIAPHPNWFGSANLETHTFKLRGGNKAGLIILPPLKDAHQPLPPGLLHSISEAVTKLRATTQIVLALSSWGYSYEQELLNSTGVLPDLLLGSGTGIGFVGNKSANGKVLWIRPYAQGKSVERIDIYEWPERTVNFKWTDEQNVRMSLFGLTDQLKDDRRVLSLIQTMGTD